MRDEFYEKTLAWVNEIRSEYELPTLAEMPEGDCLGGSCPIYNALKDTGVHWVGRSWMTRNPNLDFGADGEILLPNFAREFIFYHDRNAYQLQVTP